MQCSHMHPEQQKIHWPRAPGSHSSHNDSESNNATFPQPDSHSRSSFSPPDHNHNQILDHRQQPATSLGPSVTHPLLSARDMSQATTESSVTANGNPIKRDFAVGTSIPANLPHAVSVSLPLWKDNVDYEEGRLAQVMETGYPRFFVHRSIQKVSPVSHSSQLLLTHPFFSAYRIYSSPLK